MKIPLSEIYMDKIPSPPPPRFMHVGGYLLKGKKLKRALDNWYDENPQYKHDRHRYEFQPQEKEEWVSEEEIRRAGEDYVKSIRGDYMKTSKRIKSISIFEAGARWMRNHLPSTNPPKVK